MNNLNEAYSISQEFLQRMDDYLHKNLENLSCKDIYNIYIQFWNDLKEWRSTSQGFTGFSEFLIFRIVYHLLETLSSSSSPLKSIKLTPRGDLIKFTNDRFELGQNLPINIQNKKVRSDIVIYQKNPDNPILIGVIEIKSYPVNGKETIKDAFNKLNDIINCHPKAKGMLTIFRKISNNMLSYLQKIRNNNPWFSFLVLENNNTILANELRDWLFK